METITNVASTAATTVSNLIYGHPVKDNETAVTSETPAAEPVSGEQGKGTATDPFDHGNVENPTSSTTKPASDDFLKLNPTIGTSATTGTGADTKTGATSETSMPIVPLNPDSANLGTSTSATGVTDKAGVTDTVWKPTALDEVKPSGAPGAGPDAPSDVKTAVPEGFDGSSAAKKETTTTATTDNVDSAKDSAKDSDVHKNTEGTAHAQAKSVSPEVDAIIEGSHPKGVEHSVPEAEAEAPDSKMESKTKRNADASKPDTTGEAPVVKSEEKTTEDKKPEASKSEATKSEPSKSPERSSSGSEEKDSKMSNLKDKLKTKLHIGSKDKADK